MFLGPTARVTQGFHHPPSPGWYKVTSLSKQDEDDIAIIFWLENVIFDNYIVLFQTLKLVLLHCNRHSIRQNRVSMGLQASSCPVSPLDLLAVDMAI